MGEDFVLRPAQKGEAMIKMTTRAAQQFKEVLNNRSLPEETSLRVDVQPGETGPHDLHLTLLLDTQEPHHDDKVEVTDGARLVVGEPVALMVGDGEVDYREEEGAFIFQRLEHRA
jgi:Fe-S cluster assembly iron-binding protein IscA